jgi:hypothetical protein
VKAEVKEGKPGKEGLKPGETADASATFTVKEFEPPTISCSASPSTINPGDSSADYVSGCEPAESSFDLQLLGFRRHRERQRHDGDVQFRGRSDRVDAAITCNVADDKGHTASANTSRDDYGAVCEADSAYPGTCSISFDKKRPGRVDNEAKAALDGIAVSLQNAPDAKLVVVGESTAEEKTPKKGHKHAKVEDLAAQRAVNVKDYLVTEKGIDASRISVATGTADSATVENYLVPAGANFAADVQGTTPVDETAVKPQARKPLGESPHHHKKAAATAPGQ